MHKRIAIYLALFAGQAHAAGPVHLAAWPRDAVMLNPGDDIQAAIDAHGVATTFHLSAGVYRIQSVIPKDDDFFVGDDGAILNGANVLTQFDRDGALYVARQPAHRSQYADPWRMQQWAIRAAIIRRTSISTASR